MMYITCTVIFINSIFIINNNNNNDIDNGRKLEEQLVRFFHNFPQFCVSEKNRTVHFFQAFGVKPFRAPCRELLLNNKPSATV